MGEHDVVLGGGDIRFEFRGVGSVVIEGRAQAHEFDRGILELVLDFFALGGGEGDFDSVGVSGAQFDPLETGLRAIPDDGGDVPILGEVVGDEAELDGGLLGEGGVGGLAGGGRQAQGG